ncbi:MAG TPA: hypothetical protein VFH80_01370 [Solirubrobacteraceae bacterium]|nr:hypothetical protein [Solirubrobacteraceae bacterium]
MADASARRPAATRRPSRLWRVAAVAVTLGVLAGCGGQSGRDQVAAVAQAYNRAFVAANGRTVCALMTSSLRHEFDGSGGRGEPTSCAEFIAFAAATRHGEYAPHLLITAVHINGSRANVAFRGKAGVGTLPLTREAGRWRVAGPAHYIIRNWLQADYRLTDAGGLSASAVANILDSRARTLIGALVLTGTIGRDEVRISVAEPARLADLAPVTRRDQGRLSFYDWEADAITPDGKPVSEELERRNDAAMLISQGTGAEPPGTAGGLTLRAALKLAAEQRPVPGASPSQRSDRGVRKGWTVVAGTPPSHALVVAGEDPGARYFVLRDRSVLSRSDITDAYATFGPRGDPEIGIAFTPRGARAFQRLSIGVARRGALLSTPGLAVDQHVAVVLDGKLLSVIAINHRVYPLGIPADEATDIEGGFTPVTADLLAKQIAAEPLPADLQLIRTTTVSRRLPPGVDLPAAGTTGPRQPAGPA